MVRQDRLHTLLTTLADATVYDLEQPRYPGMPVATVHQPVPPQGRVVMRPCRLVVRGVPGREGDGLDRAGVRAAVWR